MPFKTVTFEQRPEWSERVSHVKILRKTVSERGESQGPQVGTCLLWLKKIRMPTSGLSLVKKRASGRKWGQRGHEVTDSVGYNTDFRFFLSVLENHLKVLNMKKIYTDIYFLKGHPGNYRTMKCSEIRVQGRILLLQSRWVVMVAETWNILVGVVRWVVVEATGFVNGIRCSV